MAQLPTTRPAAHAGELDARSRRIAQRPRKPVRKRASRRRHPRRERVAKGLQRKPYDGVTPRPSWRRYYQAYVSLLEDGHPVTETAIAKLLRISRMSLWRIHRRNPGLRRWVHQQLLERNEHLVGPVIHMLGSTAIRTKSAKHAELFLRAVGCFDGKVEDTLSAHGAGGGMIMNFLIPRPETPVIPGVTVREYDSNGQLLPANTQGRELLPIFRRSRCAESCRFQGLTTRRYLAVLRWVNSGEMVAH